MPTNPTLPTYAEILEHVKAQLLDLKEAADALEKGLTPDTRENFVK